MTRDPILIHCEGSGHPPAGAGVLRSRICSMCGESLIPNDDGNMPQHYRVDILAMLDRGDFG